MSSPPSPKPPRKTANMSSARHGEGRGRRSPAPAALSPSPFVGTGGDSRIQKSRCLSYRSAVLSSPGASCCPSAQIQQTIDAPQRLIIPNIIAARATGCRLRGVSSGSSKILPHPLLTNRRARCQDGIHPTLHSPPSAKLV